VLERPPLKQSVPGADQSRYVTLLKGLVIGMTFLLAGGPLAASLAIVILTPLTPMLGWLVRPTR
jgi:hypothetical protein